MLNRVTSHCPDGHALVQNDKGKRTQKHKASEVRDVQSVGWCDVCIEPYDEEERWSCRECDYDVCWRCHDAGRETYMFSLEFGSDMEDVVVWGTMDVKKQGISQKAIDNAKNDEITAKKCITSFDFEIWSINFGTDEDIEVPAITASSSATFSKSTGELKTFSFTYDNPDVQYDLDWYGASIRRLVINGTKETPPPEIKETGNWVYLDVAWGDEKWAGFGKVTFRRYGLVEVPGFGMAEEEQTTKMMSLLRQIAKDKRKIINPMRQKTTPQRAACLSRLLPSTSYLEEKFNNIRLKKEAVDKSVKIFDDLFKNEKNIEYSLQYSSGKINHKDLIYTTRLSIMAYLINQIPFGEFFPEQREKYLLSPMWVNFIEHLDQNEGKELLRQWLGQNAARQEEIEANAHEAFLAKFISTFFVSDETEPDFGFSIKLNDENGPLRALGLQYAPIYPGRKGFEGVLKSGGTEGFIAVSDHLLTDGGDICIVFQGTNELRDLLVSFNGFTTPFESLSDGAHAGSLACLQGRLVSDNNLLNLEKNTRRIHLGFYNAFLKLRDPIDKYLRETLAMIPKDKNVRIVVTGHSLGGALAAVCAAWLFELFDEELKGKVTERYPIIEGEITGKASDRLRILCMTYGSPKIGTEDFVNWIDNHKFLTKFGEGETVRAKILRLVDVMDPIVTLPPSGGGFNYIHTVRRGATVSKDGKMVFINREACEKYDDTIRGIGVIARKGAKAVQNHDLFLYMHKCLHFAWVLNGVSDGEEWTDDPLEKAFGAPTYRYDGFVRSEEFRTVF